jgi:hypothetical protein
MFLWRPLLFYVELELRYQRTVCCFSPLCKSVYILLFLLSSEKIVSGFFYNILNNLLGTNYAEVDSKQLPLQLFGNLCK